MAAKVAVPSITPTDLDPVELFTFLWSQVMLLQVWKLWIRVRAQIASESLLDISLDALVSAAGEDANTWAMMLLLLSACAAGILFPQSGKATVSLGMTSLLVLCWTGSQSNHVIMKMIMSLAVLSSYSSRRRTWGLQACHAARSFLIALYLVTALDKMNSDWFHTRYSCATLMHLGVIATPPFQWMLYAASLELIPPAAAFIEVALPVLLLLGICDRLTTVLGCIFHLLICQMLPPMSVYPFSMLMAPIYVFIIPDQSCMLFNSLRTWRWAAAIGLLVLVLHANWEAFMVASAKDGETASTTTTLFEYPPYGLWSTGVIWCWIVDVALIMAAALLPSQAKPSGEDNEGENGTRRSSSSFSRTSGCLVAVVVVLLGMCPYLGVRNYPALAMFSNLRTEGGRGNHIFLADDLDLLGWQRDYIIVHETNIRHLVNAQVDLAPLFTTRTTRVLQEAGVAREFWITPPPSAWPYAETRPFVPYAVPRLEVQRRIAPIAAAARHAGPRTGKQSPNQTSSSIGDEEVSYDYVRYTRVLARPRLAWPWLWKILGVDSPAEEDQVVRRNITYRLGVDDDLDGLEQPLPHWQSVIARFRTFDLETSPCRH